MKKLVILVILLIISIPISFAKEVSIPELFTVTQESVTTESLGKEVYYYAHNGIIASSNPNLEYTYNDKLGSDFESKTLPFGQPILTENRFSFTGKELDQELYYFGARYYDYNLGRFVSTDPVEFNHPYNYVENNPHRNKSKRYCHHMWVHISMEKTEVRKFIYRSRCYIMCAKPII